jgi:RimJ/RimL family protein N-acetyltransferase
MIPLLDDGTVRLRPHREDDVDAIVEMCRDPQFARWTTVPQPYTRDHAKRFIRELVPEGWRRGDFRGWAIESTDDEGTSRYAGNVDVRGVPVADIGFGLHRWARGRGVMTRAVRLAARWAFEHGDVAAIHWRADVGNLPSRRVAWACGFTFHGTVPRLLAERGEVVDAWIGSLLPGQEMTPRNRWLQPPVLRGERVVLRPFRDSDAPRVAEACSDPRTRRWLPHLPSPYTEDDARAWFLAQEVNHSLAETVTWCVADPDTDVLLADVGVMDLGGVDPEAGEVGYWAHPDARGRGVMTEAVRLVVGHAFASEQAGGLRLVRLTLGTADGNTASQHVARQAGFREVGRHRSAMAAADGDRVDAVWFDLLVSDPR